MPSQPTPWFLRSASLRAAVLVLVSCAGALALQPSLAADAKASRYYEDALTRYEKEDLAGAIIQRPVDSLWRVEQALRLAPGEAVLAGMQGAEGKLPALLVGATIH